MPLQTLLQAVFRHTLKNVIFGIGLMVLIALYVAVGSGLTDVRAYFEMNDLQFFNAWPLKLLMVLLVANLAVVTWTRIPFTPPRYGVWCVHAGIVTLIYGMAIYYHNKTEGLALIPVKQSADQYYDAFERALHVRVNEIALKPIPLPDLPRFNAYAPSLRNGGYLNRAGLRDIAPGFEMPDPKSGEPILKSVAQELKLPAEVKIDIVEFWPYATIQTNFIEDPSSNAIGIRLSMTDPHTGKSADEWLVASDPRGAISVMGDVEFEHRHVDPPTLAALKHAATQLHRIEVNVGDHLDTLFVEPGKTYAIGDTGYTLIVEDFNPAFPTTTKEIVPLLTMKVKSPTLEFRRQLIPGRSTPTDWKLDVEGSGPMGQRQKEPLDPNLKILYTFADPHRLVPQHGSEKRTIVTSGEKDLVQIRTALRGDSEVKELPSTGGAIEMSPVKPRPPVAVFESSGKNTATTGRGFTGDDAPKLSVARIDHVKRVETIQPVPPVQRQRIAGETGAFQVIMARVSMGEWSQEVAVPYAQWAGEVAWLSGSVNLPGTPYRLQLQLGNSLHPMPARVTLEKFDLVTYPGGNVNSGVFRDFKSTLTIEDFRTGEKRTAVAHLNNPVYFGGIGDSYWTFFQAQWDAEAQRFTVLGVGNRPGVWIMTIGCVMIVVGVLYAFYVKPLIIRRMKANALATAAAAKLSKRDEKKTELVSA